MIINDFRKLFENKNEQYPVTESFVKKGYMQKKRGYIALAKKKNVIVDEKNSSPSQKWHFLDAYCTGKNIAREAKQCYRYLLCPELLLWIAEAAGFKEDDVFEDRNQKSVTLKDISQTAMQMIDDGVDGRARNRAGIYIRQTITWQKLEAKLGLTT